MKTQRPCHVVRGIRLLVAAIVTAAMLGAGVRPAFAQDDESGVDENTYVGPNYGWSVEWDEDVWEVSEEDNSGGADFLILKTLDDETPVAYTRFYGVDGLFDDPDECAEGWGERIADGEGNEDVEATDEYDVPPAPRGGASATYTYTFDDGGGRTYDNVEHFQCQYIEEDGPILMVWIFAEEDQFEDAIPLYEDLVDAIVIPDDADTGDDTSNEDTGDDTTDDAGDDASDDDTNDEDTGDDAGEDSTGSGIDDTQYTSPTYGFSVEWDEDIWTANPDAELVDDGRVGLDRLYIEHTEDGDLFSGFFIEGKTDYDGDVADCIAGEEDLLSNDDALIDLDPYEDDQGDPIAGESDAGGEYAAFHGTYEDADGEEYELVWYIECQTLEEGESVAVFSLFTSEGNYEDELELAQDVIDSLES